MTFGGNKFNDFPQMQLINCRLLRVLIHWMSPMAQILGRGTRALQAHEVSATADFDQYVSRWGRAELHFGVQTP